MEVCGHEDRISHVHLETGLLEYLPGARRANLLSVVHVAGRYRPEAGLRGARAALDHQDPAALIVQHHRHRHRR